MIVVADSSPLITLAAVQKLSLIRGLYGKVAITPEVFREVVEDGAGLSGSSEVIASPWIEVTPVTEHAQPAFLSPPAGLGKDELSSIQLASQVGVDLLLMDDLRARKYARLCGLPVAGCIGVLEEAYRLKLLPDLREAYLQLSESRAWVDRRILNSSLVLFGLPPL